MPAVTPRSQDRPGPTVEELFWDDAVRVHAESRAPRDDEPARGFLLRLHLDPDCSARLAPEHPLVLKRYDHAKAEQLCPECTRTLLESAHSSVVRALRNAETTLLRLQGQGPDQLVPREIVHCRALRHEAETATGVHPDIPAVAQRVAALATVVERSLREAMERALTR